MNMIKFLFFLTFIQNEGKDDFTNTTFCIINVGVKIFNGRGNSANSNYYSLYFSFRSEDK